MFQRGFLIKEKNQQLEEPLEITEVSIENTPHKITSMKRGGCKARARLGCTRMEYGGLQAYKKTITII